MGIPFWSGHGKNNDLPRKQMKNDFVIDQSSTATPFPNEWVGRYCPASLKFCLDNRYASLRYFPKEIVLINADTTNKEEK